MATRRPQVFHECAGWERVAVAQVGGHREVLLSNWPTQGEPPFHPAVSQAPPRLGVS